MWLRPSLLTVLTLAFVALVLGLSGSAPAQASATLTVTTTQDVLDGNDGVCSLREAVIAANTDTASGLAAGECPAGSGADTISVPAGIYTLTIAGSDEDSAASGDLDITSSLSLVGSGVQASESVVNGNSSLLFDRVIQISDTTQSVAVEISHLTIRNGFALGALGPVSGRGGGIINAARLKLEDVVVESNYASGSGGGIHNMAGAQLQLELSQVKDNTTGLGPAGISNYGVITMTTSGVISNAGGIVNYPEGTIFLRQSAVVSNTRNTDGGGITNSGVMTIENTTLSGNAARGKGAGLYTYGSPMSPGVTYLINSTVTNNQSLFNPSSSSAGGGVALDGPYPVQVNLRNTVLAANSSASGQPDCSGTLTSLDYNLVQSLSGCTLAGSTLHVLVGTDPSLGNLSDYGGPTWTHALLPGSPAIDAGNPAGCTDFLGNSLTTDQRGFVRPFNGRCDIGAFEFGASAPPALLRLFLPLIQR